MAWETRDWYDTPLYYDIIFDAGTQVEASFLHGLWDRHGFVVKGRKRVLEAACGSGRVMAAMLERGWMTDGFDANEAMLKHACSRFNGLTAPRNRWRVWRDGLSDFEVPQGRRYHLAHCMVSTFKYLLNESEARNCLQRLSQVLLPGGLLVLGVHLTNYARSGCEHERWEEERDGIQVICNTRTWPADRRRRLERVRTRLRVSEQGVTRAQETNWQFRTYDARQLRSLLAGIGELELVACHDFQHDLNISRSLDDAYADLVVVLRRV